MAGLTERERVWLQKIEEKEEELRQKNDELKAVQAKIEKELQEQPEGQNSRLLAYWERKEATLSEEKKLLHAELQRFQDLLAAEGMYLFFWCLFKLACRVC